jgi:predicted Zn-dependent peptidase
MSDEFKAVILDASTGEVTERPFTEQEVAERKALDLAEAELKTQKDSARASALAKLAALGLTEEEIAAL